MPDLTAPDLHADEVLEHPTLELSEESILLRILIRDGDQIGQQPFNEAVVLRARKFGLAAAAVLRGPGDGVQYSAMIGRAVAACHR